MQRAELESTNEKSLEDIDVFTFYVGDTLYATRMENVLSLGQSNQTVRCMPGYLHGALGVVDYQGVAVPLFDLAILLDIKATYSQWERLADTVGSYKQDHMDWMDALEHSVRTGDKFAETGDVDSCDFGRWYKTFESKDSELNELLLKLQEPHQCLHELAEKTLGLVNEARQKEALEILDTARKTTLTILGGFFDRVDQHLNSLSRTVLLYTTLDGKTPVFSLKIGEVSDVRSYTQAQLSSEMIDQNSEAADLVEGFLSKDDSEICVLLDVNRIKKTVANLQSE